MKPVHTIESICFDGSILLLRVDGNDYSIDLTLHSKKLSTSPVSIKNNYVISPSGYGIHWPDIDEDLSIDGLLGISHEIPGMLKHSINS